ncbi:DNA-binding anti-repressor SinI [Oceanobacillus profundus]|uniref:DNA-binding anti-repressor SinI n=1 Tax=Oceanobacillus profundus TaxID=372463 RepID=A0A417YMA9_9BACI|nr:anti-repressor SinI family protein [Oceanobacillus sp.]RHW34629.1 DNA-binding anti-repressor SinI [Oceanobacillus profundus]
MYDQDWIHLMKQAKYIGLSPSEVRQLLKHLAIEEEKPLVSKISEFVTDPT